MNETKENDSVGIEDLPLYAWVKAMVLYVFMRLCILASTSLCKSKAAISLFNDLCLDNSQYSFPDNLIDAYLHPQRCL